MLIAVFLLVYLLKVSLADKLEAQDSSVGVSRTGAETTNTP